MIASPPNDSVCIYSYAVKLKMWSILIVKGASLTVYVPTHRNRTCYSFDIVVVGESIWQGACKHSPLIRGMRVWGRNAESTLGQWRLHSSLACSYSSASESFLFNVLPQLHSHRPQ